jgi:hypothetical protein
VTFWIFGLFWKFSGFLGKIFLRWQVHQRPSGVHAAPRWPSGRASTATLAQLAGSRPASGRSWDKNILFFLGCSGRLQRTTFNI